MKQALRRTIFCAFLLTEFFSSAAFAEASPLHRANSSPPEFVVDSIAPKKGAAWGGVTVTIYGKKFLPNSVYEIRFGGIRGANVTRVDNQTLTVSSPRHPLSTVKPDTVEITVTDLSETPNVTEVSPDSFIYIRPGTKLSLLPAEAYYNATAELNAVLTDSADNPIDSQTVTFTLNGLLAGTAITDKSGSAKYGFTLSGVSPGVHTGYIGASFADNPYFKASTADAKDLTVKLVPISLTVNSPVVNYGESIELKAVLTLVGVPLNGKTIFFSVNNNTAGSAVTQTDGTAAIPFNQPLDAGTYNIKAVFAEEGYDTISAAGTLTINQVPTSISVEKVEASPGSTISLTAKLSANGAAVNNGTITFTIDGSISAGTAATNDQGAATLSGVNLGALGIGPGTHTIGASFAGSNNYKPSSGSNELVVGQEATTISISNPEVDFGSEVTLTAKLTSKTTGLGIKDAIVNFTIEGGPQVEPASTNENGEASKSVNLGNTAPGLHNITASFAGNAGYTSSQASGTLTVKQVSASTKVRVSKAEGAYGGKTTLSARLTSSGIGLSGMTLHFILNGTDIGDTLTNADGVARLHGVSIAGIDAGLHEDFVEVSFSPANGQYAPSSGKGPLEIFRAATGINTSNVEAEFGSTVDLTAVLTSYVTGNGVENQTVKFTIEGGPALESAQTNSNGVAVKSVNLGNTSPGKHNITVSFGGTKNFFSSHNSAVLTVTQTQTATSLGVSNVETDGGPVTLTAKLTSNATGLGIPNETVGFSFYDGPTVGADVTDENGIASISNITLPGNLGPGLHAGAIRASFGGSSEYLPSSGAGDLKINKAQSSITVSSASGTYGGTIKLSASLKSGSSNLAGQNIKFYLNDAQAGQSTTGSDGIANYTASLGSIDAGTYPSGVKAEFAGSETYGASSGENRLTVNQASTNLVVADLEANYGSTVTLSAVLTSSVTQNGIPNKSVSFIIQGGPHITALTNGNGAASASVDLGSTSAGTHDITASFSPEGGNYTGSTAKGILTVKGFTTSLNVTNVTGAYGSTVTLEAALTSSGSGLQGKTIKFTFNNKTYSAETNYNGTARVTDVSISGFDAGTYSGVITAEFSGSGGYSYSSASGNLTVEKASTAVTVANVTGTSGGKADLSAKLTSGILPLKGLIVKFAINGNPAGEAKTNDIGAAVLYGVTLPGDLSAGQYPGAIGARFDGSINYKSSQGSGTLTITQASANIYVNKAAGPYGGKADLSARLTNSSDIPLSGRKLHFKLNGAYVNDAYTDDDGMAVLAGVSIAGIDAGLHDNYIQVIFNPVNDNYAYTSAYGQLEVTPAATSISISNMDADFGSTVTLKAKLISSVTGNGIEGRTIVFKIDGVEVGSAATGTDGKAARNYFLGNTSPGNHTIEAFFAPSGGNYSGSSGKAALNVKAASTALAVTNITGTYGATVILEATLTSSGSPLNGRTVKFSVNGNPAGSASTGSNGRAAISFSLAGLDAGFYSGAIKAEFAAQDGYSSASAKGDLTVKPVSTLLTVKSVTGTFGGTVDLTATLSSGEYTLTGKTISFRLNGEFAGNASTGTNGAATLQGVSLSGINAGTYNGIIVADFAASGNYSSSTGYGSLTVKQAATSILVQKAIGTYNGKVSLSAKLIVSSNGSALSGRTLYFRLNGADKGSAVTDNNGVAALNDISVAGLAVGIYNDFIEAGYSPSGGNYSASSGKGQLEVGLATTSIAVNKVTAIYGSRAILTAVLTSEGNPLSGKTVEFKLNNISIGTAVTDLNGFASKSNVDLSGIDAGMHVRYISASFAEQSPYKGCGNKADLEITRASTAVTVQPLTVQYSDQVTLSAKVTSAYAQGSLNSSGGSIEFKYQLADETAVSLAVVTSSGVTGGILNFHYTFTCGLAPGTYKIIAVFTPADKNNFDGSCNASPWGPLTVNPEDALAEYTGSRYFSTPSLTSYTAALSFCVTVTDMPDAFRGDISKAKIEFREVQVDEKFDAGIVRGKDIPVVLLNPSDQTVGTAGSPSYNRNLNQAEINNVGTTFHMYTYVGGYYSKLSDPTLITIGIPGSDKISGGGFIVSNSPAGKYRSKAGSKTNFGFTMKYNQSGKNALGQANVIIRGEDDKLYLITSSFINTVSAYLITNMPGKAASFSTKASLKDITDPRNPVFLAGELLLTVEMYDDGKDNQKDAIAITLRDTDYGLLYSNSWDGSKTISQTLHAPDGGGDVRVLNVNGPVSVMKMAEDVIPKEYALFQNFPNPFNPSTNIQFDLPEQSRVKVVIYNILGREIATLVSDELPAGRHQAQWNTQDGDFPSGMYILRITAKSMSSQKNLVSTKKMMLIK